ncbi:MAG: hypothetical protein Kow00114_08590 [Kiloniellaceae bacterium]
MPKRSTAAADAAAPPSKAAAKRAAPAGKARQAGKAGKDGKADTGTAALSPLDYMLQVMRDPEASPAERKWAAEKAAPYLHPRRQSVEHGDDATLRHEDALEALK